MRVATQQYRLTVSHKHSSHTGYDKNPGQRCSGKGDSVACERHNRCRRVPPPEQQQGAAAVEGSFRRLPSYPLSA